MVQTKLPGHWSRPVTIMGHNIIYDKVSDQGSFWRQWDSDFRAFFGQMKFLGSQYTLVWWDYDEISTKIYKLRRIVTYEAPKEWWCNKYAQICNFGSEHARDLFLVSIPRFLCMRNSLVPFSDTVDWPESPNVHLWPVWPVKILENGHMCNFGFWVGKLHWDHLWPFWPVKIRLNGQIWFWTW